MTNLSGLKWFALRTRPAKERLAATLLAYKGYELFLPLNPQTKERSNGARPDRALFPGYLFCRLNLEERAAPVVTTPGVVGLLGIGGAPEPIPDAEIEHLRAVVTSAAAWELEPRMHTGRRVRLLSGPFAGVEGVLTGAPGRSRLAVQIDLLGRGVHVDVDSASVQFCEAPSGTTLS